MFVFDGFKAAYRKNSMLLPPVGRISIISDFVCSTFLHCMDNYNFLGMAGHYIWSNMSLARYVFKMVGHSFKHDQL